MFDCKSIENRAFFTRLPCMYVIIDVYDSARWLEMAEDDTLVLRLLCCLDGIPAFTYNGITLMPMEFMLLNFPP